MKKLFSLLLVTIGIVPAFAFASIDANLKYGARGPEVIELQEFLIANGFLSGSATGNFYSLTRQAVIAYQQSVGLPASGFVGPLTRAQINKVLAQGETATSGAEIAETGTTTAPKQADQIALLQQQVSLLMQQLTSMQRAQATQAQQNAQVQQTLTQIAQNTTPQSQPSTTVTPPPPAHAPSPTPSPVQPPSPSTAATQATQQVQPLQAPSISYTNNNLTLASSTANPVVLGTFAITNPNGTFRIQNLTVTLNTALEQGGQIGTEAIMGGSAVCALATRGTYGCPINGTFASGQTFYVLLYSGQQVPGNYSIEVSGNGRGYDILDESSGQSLTLSGTPATFTFTVQSN